MSCRPPARPPRKMEALPGGERSAVKAGAVSLMVGDTFHDLVRDWRPDVAGDARLPAGEGVSGAVRHRSSATH